MPQAKFTLTDQQIAFLDQHRVHGFRDRSAMVRRALDSLDAEIRRQELEESANLCAEVYQDEPGTQAWVEDSVLGWPE